MEFGHLLSLSLLLLSLSLSLSLLLLLLFYLIFFYNTSAQIAPDYISEYLNFQNFPGRHVSGPHCMSHIVSPLNMLHQGLQTKNA